MRAGAYLHRLQNEAEPSGFHKQLRAWVDDSSEVARVLSSMDEVQSEENAR